MTAQEAIEWLKAIEKKYIHGGDEDFDEKRKTAIKTAVEAIEKQIPKKAVVDKAYSHGRYIVGICPNCKKVLGLLNFAKDYKCCPECGQAIDWSDTE